MSGPFPIIQPPPELGGVYPTSSDSPPIPAPPAQTRLSTEQREANTRTLNTPPISAERRP